MIYITGDTHGDFKRVIAFCDFVRSSKDDTLVILGDVGINYRYDKNEYNRKRALNKLPVTLLCIHGNHEMRPESIKSYKEIQWSGGTVYAQEEFPALLFAKDGEIYELDGKRCIAIGGAYSVDKPYRLAHGWNWFADEQPSDEIKQRVEERLTAENWQVDAVFSHTCPFKYMPIEIFDRSIDQDIVDNSTEHWLDTIEGKLDYKHWYCGHFHTEKLIDKVRFMFNDFISMR